MARGQMLIVLVDTDLQIYCPSLAIFNKSKSISQLAFDSGDSAGEGVW